jgi:hemolysin activation/secretion protein
MRLRSLLPLLALLCAMATKANAQAAPAADASGPRFDILAFVVEGDTVLGTAAIERAVYPFLGPGRSVADAEAARKALEAAYQQAGYLSVSVQLPPQQVDAGGDVRLLVQAATVDRLRVTGAQYTLPSAVAAAVPSLAPGTVPDFNAMQDDLSRLAAASAHREVTPLLAAGRAPNTLDVELKLQDGLPLAASIELNSKQSLNTRAGRLEAGFQYDNLFQRGHGIGLNWFVAPGQPSDANVLSLLYHLPLGGASVARGDTWRLRWRDALPSVTTPSATARQAMTWGLTLRNLQDSSVDIAGISSTPPALRYPVFSVGYELDLSDWGAVRGRQSRLSAELNFALRGLARRQVDCLGTVKDQFACKRDGARPDFQVLALNLSHTEPVGDWTLSGRLQGQLSDGPLVSPEQIVFGGQDSVRGYLDGEQAGDIGVALRLELATPPWRPAAGPLEGLDLRAHLFHDIARLQRLEPLPGEIRHMALASVGFGIGLNHRSGLQATLGWAWLLEPTEQVAGSGQRLPISGSGSNRRQRWDLSLRQSF